MANEDSVADVTRGRQMMTLARKGEQVYHKRSLDITPVLLPYAEKYFPPRSPNAFESLFIAFLKPDIMQWH
jgi:hypothetical protein